MQKSKYSDQEWFGMICECMTGPAKVKDWCLQHGITSKALYYHARDLRKKGYDIPSKAETVSPALAVPEKQEIVCIGFPETGTNSESDIYTEEPPKTAAIRIDFHGICVEVSNQAAHDTITNTLRALQEVC